MTPQPYSPLQQPQPAPSMESHCLSLSAGTTACTAALGSVGCIRCIISEHLSPDRGDSWASACHVLALSRLRCTALTDASFLLEFSCFLTPGEAVRSWLCNQGQ